MINWKLRLKNRSTLTALASAAVLFASQVASALGLELPVGEDQALACVTSVLAVLAAAALFAALAATEPVIVATKEAEQELQPVVLIVPEAEV